MKWWFRRENTPETLPEADSARLRRLDRQVQEMADDLSLCLDTIPKINARLRQRARRESENVEGAEAPAQPTADFVPAIPATSSEPMFTKDQLRAFARQKGIRA